MVTDFIYDSIWRNLAPIKPEHEYNRVKYRAHFIHRSYLQMYLKKKKIYSWNSNFLENWTRKMGYKLSTIYFYKEQKKKIENC